MSCPHPSLSFFVCPSALGSPQLCRVAFCKPREARDLAQATQQEGRKCSKNLAMASQGSVGDRVGVTAVSTRQGACGHRSAVAAPTRPWEAPRPHSRCSSVSSSSGSLAL